MPRGVYERTPRPKMSDEERRARKRAYYHLNRDRELARARVYLAENRDAILARRRALHVYNPTKWEKALERNYGLSAGAYARLHELQGGLCAICKQPERAMQKGRVVRLGVDHDHATGKVRGLLCRACNRAVGTVENVALVVAIHSYLESPPCQ